MGGIGMGKPHHNLEVWKRALVFVTRIYKITGQYPDEEKFGLVSQMRRAAVSIPANICEGFKKKSPADKLRFFNIAQGSLEECRYYLILIKDLNYGDSTLLMSQLEEVSKLLISYSKSLLNSNS